MKFRITMLAAVLAVGAAAGVSAQSSVDRSFTASPGDNCTQVVWSQEALAKYPKIAVACKEVMQRNGKTYVKFEGEVKKVANKGQDLYVDFGSGGKGTLLNPKEGASVNIDGKTVPVRQLRPGDTLTFYIDSDRLSAHFPDPVNVVQVEEVPMVEAPAPAPVMAASADMPKTASSLPMLGLAGLMLLALGAGMTVTRWMRGL